MGLQDVDIVLKGKIDIPVVGMANVGINSTDNPTIVFISGGGKIQIDDWQTDFAPTIVRNFARADINVKIGGDWFDYSNLVPEITRDEDGLLLSVKWIMNISETIEEIIASIY